MHIDAETAAFVLTYVELSVVSAHKPIIWPFARSNCPFILKRTYNLYPCLDFHSLYDILRMELAYYLLFIPFSCLSR